MFAAGAVLLTFGYVVTSITPAEACSIACSFTLAEHLERPTANVAYIFGVWAFFVSCS